MNKPYNEFSFIIDLIIEECQITNPILIVEKAKEIFDTDLSIHYVSDYLAINHEDLEKSNREQYYQLNY